MIETLRVGEAPGKSIGTGPVTGEAIEFPEPSVVQAGGLITLEERAKRWRTLFVTEYF